jgi:pSer/pThr/pTyr-binding forkhead associated (FHA) protein
VAQAFILNMYATDDSHLGQRKFSGLPIRVGRNALNDWQVEQTFVSDFHARIEEVDGQLAVRDLNSKNGVYVRPDPQSPSRQARAAAGCPAAGPRL